MFHAAAGGVGQILCQWANAIGCTVIGTVGSKEKEAIAKKNGCHHVINYTDNNFVEEVEKIVGKMELMLSMMVWVQKLLKGLLNV